MADVTTSESAGRNPPARAQLGRYVNILHLTDLHFRSSDSADEATNREKVHTEMLRCLEDLVEEGKVAREKGLPLEDWTPDVVVISGDIAWSGVEKEYREAEEYLTELLKRVGREWKDVVMCPGNHDRWLDPNDAGDPPSSAADSDEQLSLDRLSKRGSGLRARFSDYVEFCERRGVMKPEGLPGTEYLTGTCKYEIPERDCAVQFLVVNSAWYSRGKAAEDLRNLWLGLPLIRRMALDVDSEHPPNAVRVGLCHHPHEWLHEEEHDSYDRRANPYHELATRCQVLLHGHVHGSLKAPSRNYNVAQTFTGGATYAGGQYNNNFSLLQLNLDDHSVRRRGFEYDPREPEWRELLRAKGTYDLELNGTEPPPDPSVEDLANEWSSVFWQEELPSELKPTRTVSLVRTDPEAEGGTWFRTADWNDSDALAAHPEDVEGRLSMRGKLEGGYFTGMWKDPRSVREDSGGPRFGSFQLTVCSGGSEMVGRWVGFGAEGKVLTGRWRFLSCEAEQA